MQRQILVILERDALQVSFQKIMLHRKHEVTTVPSEVVTPVANLLPIRTCHRNSLVRSLFTVRHSKFHLQARNNENNRNKNRSVNKVRRTSEQKHSLRNVGLGSSFDLSRIPSSRWERTTTKMFVSTRQMLLDTIKI